jgi:hypothetical protein
MFTFIKRYVPNMLTESDKQKQRKMLTKSRKMYKQKKYYTRKPVASYKHKTSSHITNAKRIYGVQTVAPNQELARKTGCSVDALKKIVKKGQGAYYSSGSRPNQTSQSWGLARLASSITAGNASIVDYDILEKGCVPTSKALKLAKTRRNKKQN